MNKIKSLYDVKNKTQLWNLALLVFIAILVLHGTYIRVRLQEEALQMDWVVLLRLIACSFGFVIGVILLLKSHARFGVGSIILLSFLAATGVSAINSPYPMFVFGYFILLMGGSFLVFGLVQAAPDNKSLELIERVWFYTIALCVLKDAVTSLIIPDPDAEGGILRLGMGITHANQIGLLAGLVFLLSFRQSKSNFITWFLRIAMIFVVFGAISRIALLAFFLSGFCYFLLKTKGVIKKVSFTLICLSAIVVVLLLFSFNPRLSTPFAFYAQRGQTETEMATFTGRTYIWKQALSQFQESPLTGHGYGVTQFTLKPVTWGYQATHCHNEIIEALFSIGIVGTIPLLIIILYNMKWLASFSRLSSTFPSDMALHAACVFVMLVVAMIFEARISVRLLPYQPLFFFYLLLLDREKQVAGMQESTFQQPDRD